ncbi:14-3-3 protein [Cyclospora cayetanensis]|uniref:14-3-3 protein n=1 Tax=Cyclospora cayetanensis TaxID=88456 RepID=A0A6P6RZM3_9EIME|nr:14-3-3 protein [Cyclospora cayetanensis]
MYSQVPQHQDSQQQLRPRIVAWQTPDSYAKEDDSGIYDTEAKIEVTAQCRPKEDVYQVLKEVIRVHPSLSPKHRELLGNTVKGLIADRCVAHSMISAMRAMLSAAGTAWQIARGNSAAAAVCLAAAGVAAELTMAGVSPREAGKRAAEVAVAKGVGATRNLVSRHKVEQQRQHNAAAAAAALRRAQEAAEAAGDYSGNETQENPSSTNRQNVELRSPPLPAPDSAAALSAGVHVPQYLVETATSEAVLQMAAYFDKRLDLFLRLLADEIRNLARSTWKLVEEKLLPATDSKEAKVFYLQLSADTARYTSQVVNDTEEENRLRKQSIQFYRTALALFEAKPAEQKEGQKAEGKDEQQTLLGAKMGLKLNYAVLLHDEENGIQEAIDVLADQFREAVANVVHITDGEESRRVMTIMSLIRGNVENWCRELGRNDATALLGLDGSAAPVI